MLKVSENPIDPHKTEIQDNIIKILQKNKTNRFTELKNILGVSKPVLSYHLKILKSDKTIDFTKKGREKYYRLTKTASNNIDRKIVMFGGSYRDLFAIGVGLGHETITDAYKDIGDRVNAYFLFSLLKTIESGKNWFRGFDSKDMGFSTINYLLNYIFLEKEAYYNDFIEPLVGKKNMSKLLDEINKPQNRKIILNRVKTLFEQLKILYPDHVKLLEKD